MAITTSWTKVGLGDWGNPLDWSNGVPGLVPNGTGDVATLRSGPPGFGGIASFTVTVGTGEFFSLGTLNISSIDKNHSVALEIEDGATLTTNTLALADLSQDNNHLTINNGGVLGIVSTITSARPEAINIGATGASGGRLQLGGIDVNSTNVTFNFLDNAPGIENDGVIEYQTGFDPGFTDTQQHITGVSWGDGFIFDGAVFTTDTVTYDSGTSTITVDDSVGNLVLTMNNVTAPTGQLFEGVGDEIVAVCYARGTMIRTLDGELPVEKLRPGKRVITLAGGEEIPQTVIWLGHRRVDLAAHPRPEMVAPIRIRRDAFADGMPHRDLLVSPDHAIFVHDKLICARQLVNGTTIRQELDWTAVDYYHVELDQHAILLAEGLPAESYIDTGNSGFFANSGAPMVLHPDLTDETGYPTRQAGSCAPFVWDEASVQPVWQELADRATALGQPVPQQAATTDAELRLFAKYHTAKPIYGDNNLVIFNLPRGVREARLLSRAQSPAEARPWLDDRRRLGVCVKRIVLRGVDDVREVPVDHPGLTQGWWAVERDGQVMSRWTDGDAVLPVPAMSGNVMLEIHLAGSMTYVLEAAPEGGTERRAA